MIFKRGARVGLFWALLFSTPAPGLEVDEKLTVRILRLSQTKKTALVNRGLEDGLVVGDHAKFFLTQKGVVARGVVAKASPTRSVWSIYRILHPGSWEANKVLGMKISPPIKITDDPSKDLKGWMGGLRDKLAIPGGEAQIEGEGLLSDEDRQDLKGLGVHDGLPAVVGQSLVADSRKDTELFILGPWHSLGARSEDAPGETTEVPYQASGSEGLDFILGVEKYLSGKKDFWGQMSVFILAHIISTGASDKVLDGLEYGGGATYHFFAHPLVSKKVIGFISGSLALGKNQDYRFEQIVEGPSLSFSWGGGIKYFWGKALGLRAFVDFYQRSESYETTRVNYVKELSGLRFGVGVSFRLF